MGELMRRARTRMAIFFLAIGLTIYVVSSLFLVAQGHTAAEAFRHVSIFYVPFLLAGAVCAVAAVEAQDSDG